MTLGPRGRAMKQVSMRSMIRLFDKPKLSPVALLMFAATLWTAPCVRAQTMKTPGLTVLPQSYGPYSGHFLQGGIGLTKPSAGWCLRGS